MKSRKNLAYIFCCVYMYFSFAIVNQAHTAFEVGDFNQAYQENPCQTKHTILLR